VKVDSSQNIVQQFVNNNLDEVQDLNSVKLSLDLWSTPLKRANKKIWLILMNQSPCTSLCGRFHVMGGVGEITCTTLNVKDTHIL
jgi:hypothetical protein